MDQPGVEVRPLREMTGRALFSEVFFDDARVRDDTIIGGLNNGWAVANTTLANERAGLGSGGGGAGGGAFPGKKAGMLERARRRPRRPDVAARRRGAAERVRWRGSTPPASSPRSSGAPTTRSCASGSRSCTSLNEIGA